MSEVRVKVSILSAIQTGLNQVRSQFNSFRKDISGTFANFFAVGAVTAGLNAIITKAREVASASKNLGINPEDFQRVTNVAHEQGVELDRVQLAWGRLIVNQQKAKEGNDEMRKHFADLGITMQEVEKMTPTELFYRVADATKTADDRSKAYATTVQLMGRGAGVLYSTLERGSDSIKHQGDEIGVLSNKATANLKKLSDELNQLKQTFFIYGGSIISFFKNVIETVGQTFGNLVNTAERSLTAMGNALSLAAHGHFIEAGKALASGMKQNVLDTMNEFKAIGSDIWSKPDEKPASATPSESELSKSEQGSLDKIAELRARLADMQRKASNDQLSVEEKINAMIAQRAALLKEAMGEKDEEKSLNLQIDAQKISDEIEKTKAAREKEIADAQDRLEKSTRDRQYAELSTDAQRRRFLQDEIEDLNKMIAAEEDSAKKLDFETQREDDYKKLENLAGRSGITVVADSLARIGGGGGKSISGGNDAALHEARQHTKLLQQLVKNTEPQDSELRMK